MSRMLPMALAALAASACVPKQGRLESNRFQHEEYPYALFYADGGTPDEPLGPHWRLDNFSLRTDREGQKYVPKQGPEYLVKRSYDVNNDGKDEVTREESFYDVLLDHTQKDATMWVRTVPIAPEDHTKELRVFAERYIEAVAREGQVVAHFGTESATSTSARRFAQRVLLSSGCTLSKREAWRIDFEVANEEQGRETAGTRYRRGSVVLVRTGYEHQVPVGSKQKFYPVLMVLGVSADPAEISGFEPDFEKLLKQTVLGDLRQGLSMNGETTCVAGQTPAAAPAPLPPTSGGENPDNPESLLAPTPPEMLEPSTTPESP